MALFPIIRSLMVKQTRSEADPEKLPITRTLVEGCLPSQCMGNTKHERAVATSIPPLMSSWNIFSRSGAPIGSTGDLKQINMVTAATNPMGRLILFVVSVIDTLVAKAYQKQNRQPTLSVRAPPKSGPRTLAQPNVMPRIPMYRARYFGPAVSAIMINAPVMIPPLPQPAMTRPKISISLLGASAHMMLPISKTIKLSRNTSFNEKYLYALPQHD